MKQELYKQNMDFVRETSNYNKYIADSVDKYLGKRILDVGCGIGNTTAFIRNGRFVYGIDVSDFYLCEFKKNLEDVKAVKADISKSDEVDFLKEFHFDTIFSSNVLEHIENDISAIENIYKILDKNGTFVLLVPQYNFLYGTLDQADLHYRRYSKQDLSRKLTDVGFRIQRVFCLNFPGIFWWYLNAKILKRHFNTSSEAGLINNLIPLVKIFDRLMMMSVGLSLVVIGEK
jgi:2-polyprenyl-3-methyl-5-hydroxy-6-metoxy-1,4-benzoquinol methylase